MGVTKSLSNKEVKEVSLAWGVGRGDSDSQLGASPFSHSVLHSANIYRVAAMRQALC